MTVIRHTGNCGLLYFLAETYSAGTVISISSSADCSPSIPRLNTDPLRPDRGSGGFLSLLGFLFLDSSTLLFPNLSDQVFEIL
jgi:hypothetical protein